MHDDHESQLERKVMEASRPVIDKTVPIVVRIWMELTLKRIILAALAITTIYYAHHFATHDWTTRQEADQIYGEACMAASKAYLGERANITEFLGATFQNDPLGNGREVSLAMIESNEQYDKEKKYTCVFKDDLTWFGYHHFTAPYSFRMDDNEFVARDVENANTPEHIKNAIRAAAQTVNPPSVPEE